MRIWDIHPGYLNRQSLLGEHRELHGIVSIIANGKKGYSKHPETIRWIDHGWALRVRHQLLAAEMSLRRYTDKTPVHLASNQGTWPAVYIDEPGEQFKILADKYQDRDQGRIPLPKNAQQLWSQHKYSILARNVGLYQQIGKQVATMAPTENFSAIAKLLAEQLRIPPTEGGTKNALLHMWGYISQVSAAQHEVNSWSLLTLFNEVQRGAVTSKAPYLMASTALSELQVWISEEQKPQAALAVRQTTHQLPD